LRGSAVLDIECVRSRIMMGAVWTSRLAVLNQRHRAQGGEGEVVADLHLLEGIDAHGGRLQWARDHIGDTRDFALKLLLIRRMQARGLVAILREVPNYRSANLNETVLIQVKILDAGRRVLNKPV